MMKPVRNMRGATWSRRSAEANRLALKLDRLLERAENSLDGRDPSRALEALESLPSRPWPEVSFHLRAADIYQTIGMDDAAEIHYRAVLEADPRSSDALHGLGSLHQARGEQSLMVDAWLAVRDLDLAQPPMPWSISTDEFAEIAERAYAELPEHIQKKLDNLPILVADYPEPGLVEDGVDPRVLGIITGVPYPEQNSSSAPALDCVQLYQRNIERIATNRAELEHEIRVTVLHETAHYFGLDDDDLEEIGLG